MVDNAEFKLSAEQIAELKGMTGQINRARTEINRLKRVGLNTETLEKSLTDAVRLRDDLIKVYG